jgi:hypothetical protein
MAQAWRAMRAGSSGGCGEWRTLDVGEERLGAFARGGRQGFVEDLHRGAFAATALGRNPELALEVAQRARATGSHAVADLVVSDSVADADIHSAPPMPT